MKNGVISWSKQRDIGRKTAALLNILNGRVGPRGIWHLLSTSRAGELVLPPPRRCCSELKIKAGKESRDSRCRHPRAQVSKTRNTRHSEDISGSGYSAFIVSAPFLQLSVSKSPSPWRGIGRCVSAMEDRGEEFLRRLPDNRRRADELSTTCCNTRDDYNARSSILKSIVHEQANREREIVIACLSSFAFHVFRGLLTRAESLSVRKGSTGERELSICILRTALYISTNVCTSEWYSIHICI